jgi:hypothetical protein
MKNRNTLDPTIPPPPLVDSDDPVGREHYSPTILSISVILNTPDTTPFDKITPTPKNFKKFGKTSCQTIDRVYTGGAMMLNQPQGSRIGSGDSQQESRNHPAVGAVPVPTPK